MKILTLNDRKNVIEQNSYLLIDNDICILIDAGISLDELKKYTTKLDAVLLTHAHYDHILFLNEINGFFNCPIYVSKIDEKALYSSKLNLAIIFGKVFKFNTNLENLKTFEDNEIIKFGNLAITCLLTSGHTAGSSCFLIDNNLFSGDTLFADTVGRTDLPTSSRLEQKSSLKRLDSLNFNNLYPGHGRASTRTEQNENIKFWLSVN